MRILLVIMLVAACHDAAPLPCDPSFDNCQAAVSTAEAICDLRIRCDETFDAPRDRCISDVTADLCETIVCNAGPYNRRDDLDACNRDFSSGPCDAPRSTCQL